MAMLAAAALAGLAPSLPASAQKLAPLTGLQYSTGAQWFDDIGVYHVVGEVSNPTTQTAAQVRVTCSLMNNVSSLPMTESAFTEADFINSGEKAPFQVLFFGVPLNHGPASCNPSGGVATQAIANHNFKIDNLTVTSHAGTQTISGTITNQGGTAVGPVKLMLTYESAPGGPPVDEISHPLPNNPDSSLGSSPYNFTFEAPAVTAWTPPLTLPNPCIASSTTTTISCLAEAPAPTLQLPAASADFGGQIEGTISYVKAVPISNIGDGDLHVNTVVLDNTSDFGIMTDRCSGQTVGPGQSCSVDVVFHPMVLGPTSASMTVTSDAPELGNPLLIVGKGLSRTDGSLSPGTIDFGLQPITTSSPPQTVLLTSVGPDPLSHISVAVSSNFIVAADGCTGQTVAVGSSCSIGVSFAPTTALPVQGELTVTDDGRSSPQHMTLTGTGGLLALELAPSSVDFKSQLLGTSSGQTSVTMTNIGNEPVQLGTVTESGVNAADFSVDGDTCSGTQLTATTGSCAVTVHFAPSAAGSRTAVLDLPVSAQANPLTVLLMGTGVYPTPPPLNGGQYHPLDPMRIVDTRTGPTPVGRGLGIVAPGETIAVQVTGRGGVPDNGSVSAVVVNVTVTQTTGYGYLTIYPTPSTPTSPPLASSLNWTPGKTVPNLVEVALGDSGQISIFNGPGSAAQIIVDVEGYVSAPSASPGRDGRFVPMSPLRLLDTRTGPAPSNAPLGPVGGGQTITVNVLGQGGVPASGVEAVVLNVTVTGATTASYLTVFPSNAAAVPLASNLNFVAGQTVPNRVIVKVGADGAVAIFNGYGSVHIVVDVNGWFSDDTNWQLRGSGFTGTPPARILDTRTGPAPSNAPLGPVGGGQTIRLVVAGRGLVPGMNSATPPSAVVLNVTVTQPTSPSFLTIWPSDIANPPLASDLNFVGGDTVPNLVVVKLGADGSVLIYNGYGSTQIVADVVGWYS